MGYRIEVWQLDTRPEGDRTKKGAEKMGKRVRVDSYDPLEAVRELVRFLEALPLGLRQQVPQALVRYDGDFNEMRERVSRLAPDGAAEPLQDEPQEVTP
jgi:hypothetical protein